MGKNGIRLAIGEIKRDGSGRAWMFHTFCSKPATGRIQAIRRAPRNFHEQLCH
jgi:hypothetical protein